MKRVWQNGLQEGHMIYYLYLDLNLGPHSTAISCFLTFLFPNFLICKMWNLRTAVKIS